MSQARILALVLVYSSLGGCVHPSALGVRSESIVVASGCPAGQSCADTMSVTFMGVGGFVIRHGNDALMTAPLFTRPSLQGVIHRGGSDTAEVDRMLQRVHRTGIHAILVGHSHYDHLMDVPRVLQRLAPTPMVIGSATTGHALAADPTIDRSRMVVIDTTQAASPTRQGQWQYVTDESGRRRYRVMAVMSTHAPNIADVTISNFALHQDLATLPLTPFDWPKGEVFAYIIDALGADGRPVFRIYYQDSASDPEHSVRPMMEATDTKTFDLVIVCGGNFEGAESYPTSVLDAFKPAYSIVGHWDDFFRSADNPTLIPGLNGRELKQRMNASMKDQWAALRPFSTAIFVVAPR